MSSKKYQMISCAVLARECYHCAAITRNLVDIKIVEQGLHDIGQKKMSSALQQIIDDVDKETYDAILLAYGLCSNGICNVRAEVPMVVPRAHDCITLLMGNKVSYQKYFTENPGTFYHSCGWVERAGDNLNNPDSVTKQMGMGTYEDYVAKYGEENARYLMDVLGDHLVNYKKLTFIDTGIPNLEMQKRESKNLAKKHNWEYSELKGSTRLLLMMMNGEWPDDEFLVVEPGKTIEPSYDHDIIQIK